MRLKSAVKVTDSKLHPHTYVAGSLREVEHDAACAHALMLALRCEAPGVYARAIAKADELMAEWGFDSVEDA